MRYIRCFMFVLGLLSLAASLGADVVDDALLDMVHQKMALGVAMGKAALFFRVKQSPDQVSDTTYLTGALGVVNVGCDGEDFMKIVRERAARHPARIYGDPSQGYVELEFYEKCGDQGVGYDIRFQFAKGKLRQWICAYGVYLGVVASKNLEKTTNSSGRMGNAKGAGR